MVTVNKDTNPVEDVCVCRSVRLPLNRVEVGVEDDHQEFARRGAGPFPLQSPPRYPEEPQ